MIRPACIFLILAGCAPSGTGSSSSGGGSSGAAASSSGSAGQASSSAINASSAASGGISSEGSSSSGARVCAVSGSPCGSNVPCGAQCCGPGEWCDESTGGAFCRCGNGNACTGNETCEWPLVTAEGCGGVCCDAAAGNCPISRRAAKEDIRYLDEADLARAYRDLRDIRLATYRYRSQGATDRRHLGFIIDDTRSTVPINADGNTVDLYGYASLAVAAVQVQAQQIHQLTEQVRILQERLAAQDRKRTATGP